MVGHIVHATDEHQSASLLARRSGCKALGVHAVWDHRDLGAAETIDDESSVYIGAREDASKRRRSGALVPLELACCEPRIDLAQRVALPLGVTCQKGRLDVVHVKD